MRPTRDSISGRRTRQPLEQNPPLGLGRARGCAWGVHKQDSNADRREPMREPSRLTLSAVVLDFWSSKST
eukprot:4944372-Prymnesium_polylepis.3